MKNVTLLAAYWNIASNRFDDVRSGASDGAGDGCTASVAASERIRFNSAAFSPPCVAGSSRYQANQTAAQTSPVVPVTTNVIRQPNAAMSHGSRKSDNAAPTRAPE